MKVKLHQGEKFIRKIFSSRKRIVFVFLSFVILIGSLTFVNNRRIAGNSRGITTVSVRVGRSFDFPAINNDGTPSGQRIIFTVSDAEKTDQVIVKDQTFVARNNKMFLIVNLELKNNSTQPLNIVPGDLMRLTYGGDENNRFAADLHNNLVLVAPISTRLDRVGFVIPKDIKKINLYVGELEGRKEVIPIQFPS